MPTFTYLAAALVLVAATTVGLSLGRLWRRRPHASDVGAVSQRWLSEIRREDEP